MQWGFLGGKDGVVGAREPSHPAAVDIVAKIPWLASASRRKRWLVGVSGGADSVALLHLLVAAGFRKLVVCHFDHRLRGRASTGDAVFVRKLAESLGMPFECGRADVKRLAEQRRESVETAARYARQDFFSRCAAKHRCFRIVLAHHADDQAETVLWNLVRGSHGPKGMSPVQRIGRLEIHRPLLSVRREELREWLVSRRLKWREDATNAEPFGVRNRLRNEALPLLAEIARRDVVPAILRSAAAVSEMEEIAEWTVTQAAAVDPQGRLHLPRMRELPRVVQAVVLRSFLLDQGVGGIDRSLLDRCLELLEPAAPPVVNLQGGRFLRRSNGRVYVTDGR
jgi:tRNA(Ile)-lysidine synthase